MAIDPSLPGNNVPVNDIPKWLRDTRLAYYQDTVHAVSFEAGVERGHAVFYNPDKEEWQLSLASSVDRNLFQGIADPQSQQVRVHAFFQSDTPSYNVSAAGVYVSTDVPGLVVSTPTELYVGQPITADTIFIESRIGLLGSLWDEVAEARDGEDSLLAKLIWLQTYTNTVASNLTTALQLYADNAASSAVLGHETSYDHLNIPTTDQKQSFPPGASSSNLLILDDDGRLGDDRIPLLHGSDKHDSSVAQTTDPRFPTLTEKANLSIAPVTVSNIAELRLRTDMTNPVQVLGYYTPGDGGGGPVRIGKTGAPPGTYVDNGGSIIVPTGGDGSAAWVWEHSGAVNVKWFGAKGDGVADDTVAIQGAEDYATSLGVHTELEFQAGVYAITTSIQKKTNVHWRGVGQIERLNNATATGASFGLVVANAVNDWTIEGIQFKNVTRTREFTASLTSNVAIGNTNTCLDIFGCSRWAVRNCIIRQFTYGVLYRECHDFSIIGNRLYADSGKTIDQIENGTYTNFPSYAGTGGIINLYKASGINLPSSQYIISDNLIEIPGLDIGIGALSQTYDKMPCTIANNIVKGCLTGIQLYRGSFDDPGTAPTYNSAIIVIGNRVYASWGAGIYIRSVIGVQVIGNYLERCGAGGADGNFSSSAISLRVNPFTTSPPMVVSPVSNDHAIIIRDNRIVNYGRNDIACDPAILIEQDNVLFDGNEINRAAEVFGSKRGVAILVGNGKKLRNSIVTNNKILGTWTRGIEVSDIWKSANITNDYLIISDNAISGIFDFGITVDWRSFNAYVLNNDISGTIAITGINLRNAPYSEIVGNRVRGAVTGINLSGGNLASNVAQHISGGVVTGNIRRGGTLIVQDNSVVGAKTAYALDETNGDDANFYGRCLVYENNYQNGSKVFYEFTNGIPATTANTKIWSKHEVSRNINVAVGQPHGRVCVTPGQYGSMTTATGDTTNGSPIITNVSSLDGYGPGIFITATGFSGVVRVVSIDPTMSTITVSANATATNLGVTLTAATPTFAAMPNLV